MASSLGLALGRIMPRNTCPSIHQVRPGEPAIDLCEQKKVRCPLAERQSVVISIIITCSQWPIWQHCHQLAKYSSPRATDSERRLMHRRTLPTTTTTSLWLRAGPCSSGHTVRIAATYRSPFTKARLSHNCQSNGLGLFDIETVCSHI